MMTVSELNKLINTELTLSPYLQRVEVEAEIGRITKHSSGHYYFLIKDKKSSIDCVMFKSAVMKLKNDFSEGDFVKLKGRVSIYEQNARLQLYVTSVELQGEGKFLKEFFEMKEKLSKEGIFNSKKELKPFPSKIALLTSKSSAAIKDFKKVISNRNPLIEVVDYNVNMQSNQTPLQIIEVLKGLEENFDLVVITRGGGSYEDLRYFNDEELARYIYEYNIPIISAIGHEIDFTIIEYASDYRAATPTMAAEMATDDIFKYLKNIQIFLNNSSSHIHKDIELLKKNSNSLYKNIEFLSNKKISEFNYRIQKIKDDITNNLTNLIDMNKLRLDNESNYLSSINPLNIINKGYGLISKDNIIIKDIKKINVGDDINIKIKNGNIFANVKEVIK